MAPFSFLLASALIVSNVNGLRRINRIPDSIRRLPPFKFGPPEELDPQIVGGEIAR